MHVIKNKLYIILLSSRNTDRKNKKDMTRLLTSLFPGLVIIASRLQGYIWIANHSPAKMRHQRRNHRYIQEIKHLLLPVQTVAQRNPAGRVWSWVALFRYQSQLFVHHVWWGQDLHRLRPERAKGSLLQSQQSAGHCWQGRLLHRNYRRPSANREGRLVDAVAGLPHGRFLRHRGSRRV